MDYSTIFTIHDACTFQWQRIIARRELNYFRNIAITTEAKLSEVPLTILFQFNYEHQTSTIFDIETDAAALIECSNGNTSVSIAAHSNEKLEEIAEKFFGWLPTKEISKDEVRVKFWFNTTGGPNNYTRKITTPQWQAISENYPDSTNKLLSDLMEYTPDEESGKLIIWRGQPGTGKTFALRALSNEWKSWCSVHYILDPESFLDDGSYLYQVALGGDSFIYEDEDEMPYSRRNKDTKWRLVILEDTGEVLAKDAKDRQGQRLARLLNVCDGLLGQGSKVMVMISTNEEVGGMHEAVLRPGRCLAEIEFKAFNKQAAKIWLDNHKPEGMVCNVGSEQTLARMYAKIAGKDIEESVAFGFGGMN